MKLFRYILVCSLGALALTSCKEDYLDTAPTSSVGEGVAEKTPTGVIALVNGIHNMMYSYNFRQYFGYGIPSLNYQLDMLGDDVINTWPAVYMGVYRWTDHRWSKEGQRINYKAWDCYYTLIQQANTAIHSYKTYLSKEERKQPAVKYAYGEALGLRAYAYHCLIQLFAKRYNASTASQDLGVILRTDANYATQYDPAPRATVAAVYDQIEADLKASMDELKPPTEQSKTRNHLTYSVVAGIAARVAMCKADYAQAKTYAQAAIDDQTHSLDGASLTNGFNDYTAPEWMWGYRQTEDQNYFFGSFYAHYSYNFRSSPIGALRYAVNRSLYNELGAKDVRRKWFVCDDLGDQVPKDGAPQYFATQGATKKWETTGQSIKFKAQSPRSSFGDVVIMRVAEMYYILAEAQARLGEESDAQKTLYTIVKTRDADFTQPTETGTALIDKILLHKRMDLIYEGVRFFDMKRLGTPPKRLEAANFEIIKRTLGVTFYNKAIERNSGTNASDIPTTIDDPRWQFAIPYDEIVGNKLCVQNP